MLLLLRGKLLLSLLSLLCGPLKWLFVGRFCKHRPVVGAGESYACGSWKSIEAKVNHDLVGISRVLKRSAFRFAQEIFEFDDTAVQL
jgi:hypothetical protein